MMCVLPATVLFVYFTNAWWNDSIDVKAAVIQCCSIVWYWLMPSELWLPAIVCSGVFICGQAEEIVQIPVQVLPVLSYLFWPSDDYLCSTVSWPDPAVRDTDYAPDVMGPRQWPGSDTAAVLGWSAAWRNADDIIDSAVTMTLLVFWRWLRGLQCNTVMTAMTGPVPCQCLLTVHCGVFMRKAAYVCCEEYLWIVSDVITGTHVIVADDTNDISVYLQSPYMTTGLSALVWPLLSAEAIKYSADTAMTAKTGWRFSIPATMASY